MKYTNRNGYTLIELLVVITIILLVSVVTLPHVLPALSHRQVSEASRILQAAIVGAQDAAIRYNAPRGVRLLPDPALFQPDFNTQTAGHPPGSSILAYNRIVPIEQPGDYSEGYASVGTGAIVTPYPGTAGATPYPMAPGFLRLEGEAYHQDPSGTWMLAPPNGWYWNIRVGDRVRLGDSGAYYTIVGPLVINPLDNGGQNPELFVNEGAPGTALTTVTHAYSVPTGVEFLILVNGVDDDDDGYVDNGFNGIDDDYDGLTDVKGDANETEREEWLGSLRGNFSAFNNQPYVINRVRPVVSQGARETFLPTDVVVDATSAIVPTGSDATSERSRLPIDPYTLTADILVNPNGTLVPTTLFSSPASGNLPFLHFWLAERGDVHSYTDLWGTTATGLPKPNPGAGNPLATRSRYMLPMPEGTPNYAPTNPIVLEGERRLLTLTPRSGHLAASTPMLFDGKPELFGTQYVQIDLPFLDAQAGISEP